MGANRKRMKGHCMNCACQAGRCRGQGVASRARLAELRLVGRGRRLARGEVPVDQLVSR